MRVLVTGATGYIGGRLVPRLIERGHAVRLLARFPERLAARFGAAAEIVRGDVNDSEAVVAAAAGCDAAYYLVHSMTSTRAFAEADRSAATAFARAVRAGGLDRIVYLGGLGDDRDALSEHLRSRHEVGEILRASGLSVIEFRAAQIIGSGSVSFEMMRYLTERLPVMIAPRWVETQCQPIAIADVLAYLIAALERTPCADTIYEIGGADIMSYREMMLRYAAARGLKRLIVTVPFFTPRLSSYWVHLVTPIPAKLAQPLISGLRNRVVADSRAARRDFPQVVPMGFDEAVRRALDRTRSGERETTWFDAYDLRAIGRDFTGVREGMFVDRCVRASVASPERIAAVFSSLGGDRSWPTAHALWVIRGWIDRLAGGVGLRRGRRSATDLRIGDAVDFWRVEAFDSPRILRLRAEMKLPGRAWLQFETEPTLGGSVLRQTAFFEPRGLFGHLYWYVVAPFHRWIFPGMATQIVRAAEKDMVSQ